MIFSILAFIALILSICIKDRQKSLGIQSLNCLFEAIYGFIINAFTGAVLSIINFIRTFIFIQSEKINKKIYLLILIMFESIIVANCIYIWNGLISILPTIGSIIRTYCLWQNNMKLVRISGITTGILYGLYYSYYHSWFIVMGDIILLLTSIINIYKNDIKNRKEENILIVTHNGVCRAINTYFNGIPNDNNIIDLGIKNCEVVKYNLAKDNKFVIYAHRGASAYAPENTKVAFEKAIELKSNGIELDLQKTKDGKIVIFHDDYIDKKSNGTGKIEEHTYQELLELDFGSWFDNKYKNEKIVLFEDFARDYLDKDLTFAIELKVLGIEKETLDIINKYKVHNNIYITSFLYEALTNVRKIDSNIKLSWLIEDRISKENVEKLLRINGTQICPRASLVSKEDIEIANNNGLGVRLWGIDNEEIMKKVYKLNIEGMTVNFPDKLIELLYK